MQSQSSQSPHAPLLPRILACLLALLAAGAAYGSEIVTGDNPRFLITIPDGFTPSPAIKATNPDFVHAFQRPSDGGIPTIIALERMKGMIGRERLDPSKLPAGSKSRLVDFEWNTFRVDGFEVPEQLGKVGMLTYNVQVPLKPRALQITVAGPAASKAELQSIVTALLGSLTGESNWIKSIAPQAVASSPIYPAVMLVVLGVVLLGGTTAMWFVGRRLPRGVTLGLGVLLFLASFALPGDGPRELRLVIGGLRMLGLAVCVVGVVQMIMQRPKSAPPSEATPH